MLFPPRSPMIRNINGKPYLPPIHLGKPCQEAEGSSQRLQLKVLGVFWASAPPHQRTDSRWVMKGPPPSGQCSGLVVKILGHRKKGAFGGWIREQGSRCTRGYKLFYWAVEDADRSRVPGALDGFPLNHTPSDTHVHTPICTHTDRLAPEPGLELWKAGCKK